MNTDWYITFVTMAETLNYRKASEQLFISESSVYQQIKKLEEHFEVSLFSTKLHKLSLTQAGQELYQSANQILKMQSDLELTMSRTKLKASQNYDDEIKIGVSDYIANYLMPGFIKKWSENYPNIKVSVQIIDDGSISELNEQQINLSLTRKRPASNKISFEKICEGQIGLFMPDDYQFKNIEQVLSDYPVLTGNHPTYWNSLKSQLLKINHNTDFIKIDTVALTTKLIQTKQGISFLPIYILKENPNLKFITMDIPEIVSFTYLAYQRMDAKLEKFISFFTKYIQAEQVVGESFS